MFSELLSTPSAQLGRASRFLVFQIKLWSHCIRLLRVNRAGQQAAALSYQTIFGIVPLAIVMLLIFQGLEAYSEIGDKIKNFVYDQANLAAFESPVTESTDSTETVSLTEHLDRIVAKFFTATSKGVISIVSVLFVIWAAFALLSMVEKAFNNIFHVGRGRGFVHRIVNYWAVLTLGPLLIAAGIYATTQYSAVGRIQQTVMSNIAPVVLSFLVAAVVLFLLYLILPNAKVRFTAALWGALVAAIVWVAAKNIYQFCVTELGLYRTVYGVMALIPVTVLWIYITWLIVLFGLQVTYTTQHLKTLDAAEMAGAKKRQEHFIANDFTVIRMMAAIASAFEKNKGAVSSGAVCSRFDIAGEFGQKIFEHLVRRGLLVKTSEPTVGFLPARDPATIMLSDVSEVVSEAGFSQGPDEDSESLEQLAGAQRQLLSKYSLKDVVEQKLQRTGGGRGARKTDSGSA